MYRSPDNQSLLYTCSSFAIVTINQQKDSDRFYIYMVTHSVVANPRFFMQSLNDGVSNIISTNRKNVLHRTNLFMRFFFASVVTSTLLYSTLLDYSIQYTQRWYR